MIDFEHYWREVRAQRETEWRSGAVDWDIQARGESVTAHGKRWSIDSLRVSSTADQLIYGWIACPLDHDPTNVGLLWLPGYSYGTPPPDKSNLVRGATTLCINVHGNAGNAPYVNPAGKDDYILRDIDHPERFIYRRIALHCLHAMTILGEIERVDAEKTVAAGMSQGGTLALIVAANHPAPKICFADMPFLCDVRAALTVSHSPVYKEVRQAMEMLPELSESIIETLSLFDPVNHAPQIAIPTSLVAGGKDPASRAATITPVFDNLACTMKELRLFPDAGHVFLPEMTQIYADWIDRLLLDRNLFTDA